MLSERVTRLVESGLRRSNPTKAFTVVVLATLPLASAQASAVGTTAVPTAKSAGALQTVSGLGAFIAACADVVSMFGGVIGLWGHVENTRTRRERRFIAWSILGIVIWVAALAIGAALYTAFHGPVDPVTRFSDAVGLSLLWLAFGAPCDAYVIWTALRQRQLRAEEGDSPPRPIEATRRGYRASMFGSMAAIMFGGTAWLFSQAARANDSVTIVSLLALCVAGWLGSALVAVKRPAIRAQVFIAVGWGLAIADLVTANLRWDAWHGVTALGEWPTQPAPPGVNLLILVVFASVRVGWFLKMRLLTVPSVRRDSLVALTVYLAVMTLGVALFRAAKALDVWEVQNAQVMINDIQADGTIRFQSVVAGPNRTPTPLGEWRFQNSDFVHLERMTDHRGHPLAFTVDHRDTSFRYAVSLNEVVPPGKMVFTKAEGYMTGRIREISDNEHEYIEHHWPGGGTTLRVESYRLPAGAQVLETTPADMTRRQLPDGRVELRTQRVIPPNGSITVRIRFQR